MAMGTLGCTALCGDLCKVLDIYWRRVCWVWWIDESFPDMVMEYGDWDGIEDRIRQEQLMLISFKIHFTAGCEDSDYVRRARISSPE